MFTGRADAGRQLGRVVRHRGMDVDLVLALPQGGVPVAREVVAKLGCPFAVGTISSPKFPAPVPVSQSASAGVTEQSSGGVTRIAGGDGRIDDTTETSSGVASREEIRLDDDTSLVDKHVLVVDDGVVTGLKQLAAIQAAREQGAARSSLAVPVGPPETISELDEVADEVVCLEIQRPFGSIEEYYQSEASDRTETIRASLRPLTIDR